MSNLVNNKIYLYWLYSISFLYFLLYYDALYYRKLISNELSYRLLTSDIGVFSMYINLGLAMFLFKNLKYINSDLIKSFLFILLIIICFENLIMVFFQIISMGPSLY